MPDHATILVMDDAPEICELAQAILEANGFRVLTATDGATGVILFRQHAEEIRAVLLDLIMLEMSGEMFSGRCSRFDPGSP